MYFVGISELPKESSGDLCSPLLTGALKWLRVQRGGRTKPRGIPQQPEAQTGSISELCMQGAGCCFRALLLPECCKVGSELIKPVAVVVPNFLVIILGGRDFKNLSLSCVVSTMLSTARKDEFSVKFCRNLTPQKLSFWGSRNCQH